MTTTIEIEAQAHRVSNRHGWDNQCALCGRSKPYYAGFAVRILNKTTTRRYDGSKHANVMTAGKVTLAPVAEYASTPACEWADTIGTNCAKRIGREYKIKMSRVS
jgi:hypothetical protein